MPNTALKEVRPDNFLVELNGEQMELPFDYGFRMPRHESRASGFFSRSGKLSKMMTLLKSSTSATASAQEESSTEQRKEETSSTLSGNADICKIRFIENREQIKV